MSDPAQLGSGHPHFTHHDHHHIDSSKKAEKKDDKTASTLPSKTPETDEKIGALSTDILAKSTDTGNSGQVDDLLFSLLYGSSSSEATSSESSSVAFAATDDVFKQLVMNQTDSKSSKTTDESTKPPLKGSEPDKVRDLKTTFPTDSSSIDPTDLEASLEFAAIFEAAASSGKISEFFMIKTQDLMKHVKFMLPTEAGFEDVDHSQLPHIDQNKLAIKLHKIGLIYASDGLSTGEKEKLQKQVGAKVTFVNAQIWVNLCTKLTQALAQTNRRQAEEKDLDNSQHSIKYNKSHNTTSKEQILFQKEKQENDVNHQYENKISSLSAELNKCLARIAALDEQIRQFRQLQKEKKADEKERIYLEKEILKEEIKKDSLKREIQKYEIKQKRLISHKNLDKPQ